MKPLIMAALSLMLLMGCYYGKRSATVQPADQCFLQFSGNSEGVRIIIDESTPFVLGKSGDTDRFKPLKLYQIQPGKHHIQAFKNEKMIIDQLIYIGNNETKEILIP
jgi:hypothetical protein